MRISSSLAATAERRAPAAAARALPVLVLVVLLHLYALVVFGATFWIDGRSYVGLAEGLRSAGRLAEFYESSGRWIFSHLQPGVPLLWRALSLLPEAWRWPALALAQHALAAGALFFAYATVNRYWPSRWHLAACIALLLLPAYQAFHGALLTESITSSLLLVAFAACLRLALDPRAAARHWWTALLCLALVTQFRSYWGAAVALMIGLVLVRRRLLLSPVAALLALVTVASAAAFPLYRYAQTGALFFPEGGMNVLISGLELNPHPSAGVREAFERVPFPPQRPARALLDRGLDAESSLELGRFWRAQGLDNGAINRRAETLGGLLRNDGLSVQQLRAVYGLASLGSAEVYRLLGPEREVFRGMDAARMVKHQRFYYRWHSWISDEDYRRWFAVFFEQAKPVYPFEAEANGQIARAWAPYLSPLPPAWRDPALLGRLPPDLWLLGGIAGLIVLARRAPFVALLVAAVMALSFATCYWFPLGNTRYANPLLPLYLLAASIALAARGSRSSLARTNRFQP